MSAGILVHIERDVVFIKLPLLRAKTTGSKKTQSASSKLIANEYGEAIYEILNTHADRKHLFSSAYSRKTIFYLFVLGSNSPQIDNDNYETTAVTNAIAGFFYGADSPLSCRFVFDSVLDDTIASGTYITVISNEIQMLSSKNVIDYWKKQT